MHRVEQEGEEDEDVSAKMKDKMKRKKRRRITRKRFEERVGIILSIDAGETK